MIKHTPGPWHVAQGSDERDFIVADSTGNTVCEPNVNCFDFKETNPDTTVRNITCEESKANAHLIAASPELLTAARNAVDGLEHHPTCRRAKQRSLTCTCRMADLYAAIAKAEGR